MVDTAALKSYDDIPVLDWKKQPPGLSHYELFREWREKTPLVKVGVGHGQLVVALRARTAGQVVGHETRQLETEFVLAQGVTSGPILDFISRVMLFANGETHQRRRHPVARALAFKLMEAMRPRAVTVAEELVRERLGKGPFDFVEEFGAQIPARIIADILGIPRSDLPVFMHWLESCAQSLGSIFPDRRAGIEKSLVEFHDYVEGLLADRRANPRGDFLSDYVAAAASDLSEEEVRSGVVGLIVAGADTSRNAICMTLAQLLQHPDQWRALCATPDALKKAAAEEGLRYEPIASGVPRVALTDMAVEGFHIPAGSLIEVSIISILRDPEVYANPEVFDIHRKDHPRWHFAFGGGAHRCVGEAIARIELEESMSAIARLAPGTRIVGPQPRLRPGAIRSVDQMIVEFG